MSYRHTQRAFWILIPLALCLAGMTWLMLADDVALRWELAPAALILVVIFLAFRSLTVAVDGSRIRVAFGWGWPCRSASLADVTEVRRVRNTIWHGWGIHWSLDGWVWNIAGFDAIELRFARGRKWRIGTDEPAELERAISRAMPDRTVHAARDAHQPS